MQEKSTPLVVPVTTEGSLGDIPIRNAQQHPTKPVFAKRDGAGWRDVTAQEFADEVESLAKGFIAAGVRPGDAVGIMSKTRYEWTLVDFALWTAGAVPVPIYETSSPDQVEWILKDSEAVGVVLETTAHEASVDAVHENLPGVKHVWVIDDGALDALAGHGGDVSDEDFATARSTLNRDSIATIIYTSGTTGRPKGVELSHGNFMNLVENTATKLESVVRAPGASTLLFLPLAHVFARFIEVLCVDARVKMAHSADIKAILADFASFQPTFILAVPRVFEKVYNSAEGKAVSEGKGKIFAKAAEAAIAWSEADEAGTVPFGLKVKHAVFDKLVYGKLRAAMGGKVMYAVSGGAPLGTRLGHFFRGIGVTILEGYGLTETTAPATVNLPEQLKVGTVGPPLPGVGIKIAEDGEILLSGINVFQRYHANEKATEEAMDGEWFHTGDIGELDSDGYLKITGRKKEILVTAGGKNVAPAVLEDGLRAHPLISQCIVVGDQKPFIAALLTLDEEMLPMWAANHGLEGISLEAARTNETILAELQRAVDEANKSVSKAESIRKFAVLDTDFTEDSGHLTPSLKLKRNIVMRDFSDEVDALYGG